MEEAKRLLKLAELSLAESNANGDLHHESGFNSLKATQAIAASLMALGHLLVLQIDRGGAS